MRRIVLSVIALAMIALPLSVDAAEPVSDAEPAVEAPLFLAPAAPGCEEFSTEAREMTDPPPGTECCGGGLIPDGCSGACYVEITCPDGRWVGCYGGNPDACRVEGSYVVCDANYYSCAQCQNEQPAALGCEYC